MGLSMRTFFVEGETISPVPQARFERIVFGEESIPRYAGQQIQVAEIAVELANREPTGSYRESYYWMPFDASGFADKSRLLEHARTALEAIVVSAPSMIQGGNRSNVVVQASPRFAKRRLKETFQWEPGHRLRARILELALGKRR